MGSLMHVLWLEFTEEFLFIMHVYYNITKLIGKGFSQMKKNGQTCRTS